MCGPPGGGLWAPNALEMSRLASARIVSRIRFAAAGRVGSIELLDARIRAVRAREPQLAGNARWKGTAAWRASPQEGKPTSWGCTPCRADCAHRDSGRAATSTQATP